MFSRMMLWLKKHITEEDLRSTALLLAGFSFLFFLPDKMIGPYALFNPYKTWLMVMIISGISFTGYVAIRLFGSRSGVLMTGALGGLISSTAVAVSLSGIAKVHLHHSKNFAAGMVMASTLMFLRVLFEAFVLDVQLGWKLLPLFSAAALLGGFYGLYLYRGSEHFHIDAATTDYMKHPLQISTSLKFGLIFGLIYGLVKVVSLHYGDIGVYLLAALSGITDVDAITLSLSTMAHDETLVMTVALFGITIASAVNTIVKNLIVYWIGGVRVGNVMLIYTFIVLTAMGLASLFAVQLI